MAALANFLEAEPGHITAWGDLLDCIKRWWVAAKEGVSRASTTVNGSVASDFADVWLWRLDSWREQQFGRDILRQEWARFLRSLDSENRGPAGDGAGPERRSSEETERGATSPVGVTNAGAEVGALAEKDWRNGGVENLLLEGRDQGNELATWLRTKAAVSAYLYGPQNEYAESVLRLFRQEDSKRFDGEKLARELEASFKEAEACVKVLGSERERRDERFWAAARERESATRAKEKHKKDLLASLIKSAEATGVQSRLPTKSEVSSGHLQLMGSSEGIGLEAGSGAGLGVSRGSRGRRSQDTQAPPKGLTNPGLSKGLVVAENAVTAARTVDAAPVSGSAAGLGGISEWLRTMYPRGEVAKSLEEDQGVEPSVPRQTVGLGGNGELASLAEDEATGIVAVDDTKAGGKVREGDESVFGVLEISDEWLAEVEEERRPSGTTGERSGGPAGTGGSGGRGKGDDTSDESVSERSDESDDESDEEDDDVSRKPPRKRGGKTLSGGRKRGGATRNSKRGAAAISTESGEESGEKSDDVSDGESEDVSSEETSEGSREVTRRGRKDSSSDESDDVSSGESGDVSEDGHEEGKGTQIERLTARQQALKRKREEREPVTD